jgi:hypothetical protein
LTTIVLADVSPQDGVMIDILTCDTAEEAIAIVKKHIKMLCRMHPAPDSEYGVRVEFADGTAGVWNKLQKSECFL